MNINPSITLKSNQQYSFVEMKDLEDVNKYCTPKIKKRKGGGAKFQNGDTLFARITPCSGIGTLYISTLLTNKDENLQLAKDKSPSKKIYLFDAETISYELPLNNLTNPENHVR